MASTKGYNYEKESGLYIAKRGCVISVIKHPPFYGSCKQLDCQSSLRKIFCRQTLRSFHSGHSQSVSGTSLLVLLLGAPPFLSSVQNRMLEAFG